MKREEILEKADRLINGDREEEYGDPYESFQHIADMWTVYLQHKVTPVNVATMMVLLKTCRSMNSPDHTDSYVDMAGYAALAGEMGTSQSDG